MAQTDQERPELMYLPIDQWSSRFDSNFYSVKIESKELLSECPASTFTPPGRNNHPAYYYLITVFRAKEKKIVPRRYSHFRWLYDQIVDYKYAPRHPDIELPALQPMVMPPKTCPWQQQDDDFAQNRLEQLQEFLTDALTRPGIANHPAVKQFLDLDTRRDRQS